MTTSNKTDHVWATILDLPNDILEIILEFLAPHSKQLITFDHRSSLSVESFASEPARLVEHYDPQAIGTLRLSCRHFKEIGIERQFARVTIRFSRDGFKTREGVHDGFKKLRDILEQPHLLRLVKKFSYMIHRSSAFENPQFERLLEETRAKTAELQAQLDQRRSFPLAERLQPTSQQLRNRLGQSQSRETIIKLMMLRTNYQRRVIMARDDEFILRSALSAFKNLEQIRLMRIEEPVDVGWDLICRDQPTLAAVESLPARWTRACEHAARTLGGAFLGSKSLANRISCRSLDPPTSIVLGSHITSFVAMKLECLELQFDDRNTSDEDMLELSKLFRKGFTATVNIKGLHVGFTRPRSIDFNQVFQNIYWKQLQYIGFGTWRLRSDDIINFILRHRKTLKSVRLRGVLLTDDCKWIDVLKVLRQELNLKWVSLRAVGYADQENLGGMHVQNGGDDDDDDSDGSDWPISESEEEPASPEVPNAPGPSNAAEEEGDDRIIDEDGRSSRASTHESEAGNSEVGSAVNALAIDDQLMEEHTTTGSDHTPRCHCDDGLAWSDLVDDNGLNPRKDLWKWWEKWVIKSCRLHDPQPSRIA